MRRTIHTTALAISSLALGGVLDAWSGADRLRSNLSVLTAYSALALMFFTIAIGPFNRLRKRRTAISIDLRRDAGLLAAAFTGVHVIASLGNHFGGVVARYFIDSGRPRTDRFGAMIWVGVLATALTLLLSITSNDWSVRKLRRNWKKVQRSVHLLIATSLLHQLLAGRLLHRSTALIALPSVIAVVLYYVRSLRPPEAASKPTTGN